MRRRGRRHRLAMNGNHHKLSRTHSSQQQISPRRTNSNGNNRSKHSTSICGILGTGQSLASLAESLRAPNRPMVLGCQLQPVGLAVGHLDRLVTASRTPERLFHVFFLVGLEKTGLYGRIISFKFMDRCMRSFSKFSTGRD